MGTIATWRCLAVIAVLLVTQQSVAADAADEADLARPVFLVARGTLTRMLSDLVEYEKTVEWQEIYGTVPPVDEHFKYDFYSPQGRLLAIWPGKDEFWPFIYSWLSDHRIDLACTSLEQPALSDLQPANHGGLCVPYGFAAPFIRYRIGKYNAAYILFTQVENEQETNGLLNWQMMYSIEIADADFPEQSGWDLRMHDDSELVSWSIWLPQEKVAGRAEYAPLAAWLLFRSEDIGEQLLPALSGIKSHQRRPAVKEHVIKQDDEGSIERFMSLPESESGIYRIYFSVYPKERRQAAEMQNVIADVTTWPAAHVGVFSMDDRGWLLLIFEGTPR